MSKIMQSKPKIKLLHLEEGVHEFQFTTDPESCGIFEKDIFRSPINIRVSLQKFQQNFMLDLEVTTQAEFNCDRCLKEFSGEIKNTDRIAFTLNPHLSDAGEQGIRTINPQLMEIDLKEDTRELLLLALPSKKLCSASCKGICADCGADLNVQECRCKHEKTDPRWDALKKMVK
jgi:uncharacterized protein